MLSARNFAAMVITCRIDCGNVELFLFVESADGGASLVCNPFTGLGLIHDDKAGTEAGRGATEATP